MSFPPLEPCLNKITNRYLLVVVSAKRSRQLNRGSAPQVESKRKKWTSVALEEVIAGKVHAKRRDDETKATAAASVGT
ncbi:MAG: DNA-directed RNA polymerase subunit omega [Candidatus Rokuibacteriota bacterium]